jgi:hypothetical protein
MIQYLSKQHFKNRPDSFSTKLHRTKLHSSPTMATTVSPSSTPFIIDSNGDTILFLRYPRFEYEEFQTPSSPKEATLAGLSKGMGRLTVHSPAAVADSDIPDDDSKSPDDDAEFQYLVSSTQLRSVSPYFENIFRHGFCESEAQSDGKYHIDAQDFHPHALRHVLNIVHNQCLEVPREPDVYTMAHMAVIADYYDLKKDVFAPWGDAWARQFKLPGTYGQLSVKWLLYSWYYGMEISFYALARQAILVCPDFTQTYNLPIGLPRVRLLLDKLFAHRLKHSEILSDGIERIIKKLRVNSADWESVETALEYGELVRRYLATLRTQICRFAQKDGGSFVDIEKSIKEAGKQFQNNIPDGHPSRAFYARVRSTRKNGPLLDYDMVFMRAEMLWFDSESDSVDLGFVSNKPKPEEHEEHEDCD